MLLVRQEQGLSLFLLIVWQSHRDRGDSFGYFKCLVHAHGKLHQFHNPFQFLVHLVCNEAYTDMCLYPSWGKVKDWPCLQIALCDTKRPLHYPKPVILGNDFPCLHVGIGDVAFPSVPLLIILDLVLIDGDIDIVRYLKELVVASPVDALLLDGS